MTFGLVVADRALAEQLARALVAGEVGGLDLRLLEGLGAELAHDRVADALAFLVVDREAVVAVGEVAGEGVGVALRLGGEPVVASAAGSERAGRGSRGRRR